MASPLADASEDEVLYSSISEVIPEGSKSIQNHTATEMFSSRENAFHVRGGIICVHEPAPSFPKTPSPTSESTPKNGHEKTAETEKAATSPLRSRAAPSPAPP
jgi:hypothetical protein